MEWVETTAKTVDEAKELALDQLGIDHDEAEFVIVEEPKPGLFRRMRGEARVRARVSPRKPRAKVERRGRKGRGDQQGGGRAGKPTKSGNVSTKKSDNRSTEKRSGATDGATDQAKAKSRPKKKATAEGGSPRASRNRTRAADDSSATASPTPSPTGADQQEPTMTVTLDEQIVTAEAFLTGLLDAFGLSGSIEKSRPSDDIAELNIIGDDLGILIGPRGSTIAAIQEITRITLQRQAGGSYEGRVHVDVGGYREQRRAALTKFAVSMAEKVVATGKSVALEPMSASDRKAVHDAVNNVAGVKTTSEGEDPRRWVKIVPLEETSDDA